MIDDLTILSVCVREREICFDFSVPYFPLHLFAASLFISQMSVYDLT